jgi:hypothetical protein
MNELIVKNPTGFRATVVAKIITIWTSLSEEIADNTSIPDNSSLRWLLEIDNEGDRVYANCSVSLGYNGFAHGFQIGGSLPQLFIPRTIVDSIRVYEDGTIEWHRSRKNLEGIAVALSTGRFGVHHYDINLIPQLRAK